MYVNAWCGQKHNQIHWSHFLLTVRNDKSLPHRSLNAAIPSCLFFLSLTVKGKRAVLPCICGRCGLYCFPSERWSGCTGDRALCLSPDDLAAKSSGTLTPLPCSSGKLLIPPPGCRYTPWLDSWWQHCPLSPEINKIMIKKNWAANFNEKQRVYVLFCSISCSSVYECEGLATVGLSD